MVTQQQSGAEPGEGAQPTGPGQDPEASQGVPAEATPPQDAAPSADQPAWDATAGPDVTATQPIGQQPEPTLAFDPATPQGPVGSFASAPPPAPGVVPGPGYPEQPAWPGAPYPPGTPGYPVAGGAYPPGPVPPQGYPADQPSPGQPYPGQPYPGDQAFAGQQYPADQYAQAYPGGQPYPGQPYAGASYPGQFTQPPGGPPAPRKNRTGLFILLGAGALVLALVAVFALFSPPSPTAGPQATAPATSGAPTTATSTSAPPPTPADAAAAVQGYLDALAQGDAATALSYAAVAPADTSLLSAEMLAAGRLVAPISDIRVAPSSGASGTETVSASYKVGERVVDASFEVVQTGSAWLLQDVAASVSLTSLSPATVPLAVNGVPVSSASVMLFPGSYTVAAQDARFAVSHGTFLVESPGATPDTFSMELKLSSAGTAKVRAAAQKRLNSCLKTRSLAPAGCAFGTYLPKGNKARTSTIRWTVTKGATAMKKIKPALDAGNPTMARASVNVQVKVNLSSTNGRRWYGYSAIYLVLADLSGESVKVTFP